MASGAVGQVTVEVKPDIEGFTAHMQAALFALGARDVLREFAEWLGSERALRPVHAGGDGRAPTGLVDDFIAEKVAAMKSGDNASA